MEVETGFLGTTSVMEALNTLNALCGVNVQRVNVSFRGLAGVPEALAGMESMTSLKLSWNPIKSGWEHLRPLHQLRQLDLSNWNLTELPKALVGMESVTSLNLNENLIMRGWERLRPLRQLRELDILGCGLTEVPAALASMESLTLLNLSRNQIEYGWEHLRPLTRLQKLYAAVDEESMPDALKALTNVTTVPVC